MSSAELDKAGGAVEQSVATLFVTRLPNSLSSEQLSALFSSYAPIKSAFIVTEEKNLKRPKSAIGYVKFALKTDAESCLKEFDLKRALEDLSEVEVLEGVKSDDFSATKMEWARKKERVDRNDNTEKKNDAATTSTIEKDRRTNKDGSGTKVAFDPHGPRTVLIQGLAGGDREEKDVKKQLRQKMKKIVDMEDVLQVVYPLELVSGETVASVVFKTSYNAKKLAQKLHNHVLRGSIVTTVIKSHFDVVQNLGRSRGGGRIIVRNLNFDVTEEDVRAVFGVFGALHSITLPKENGKNRGFAFVYYINREAATQAIEKLNGSRIYAGLAAERVASEGGKEGKKSEIRKKKETEKSERGRLVAVDWALSKDEFEKKRGGEKNEVEKKEEQDEEMDLDQDEEEEDEEVEDEEYDTDDTDMTPIPLEECEEVFSDDEKTTTSVKESRSDGKEDKKPSFDQLTLFVRNISFETTEAQLYDVFKTFGPLKYARIVFDSVTKKSRGTGFVCFRYEEGYQTALSEYKKLPLSTAANSLLQLDPSISSASRFSLHGRVLGISEAVGRDAAEKLRLSRDKARDKKDRRNLHLMREGVIFPTWEIAKKLATADMSARQMSFDARKRLLRTNPSLYISRTRLSIRQLPLYITDSMLKKLAKHAIREFDKEVKKGLREGLTEEEYVIDEEELTAKKDKFDSTVTQSKILRQMDRIDATTGLHRSKGYGFLQLAKHADALKVVRWANANRKVLDIFYDWYKAELERLIQQAEQGIGTYKSLSESTKSERIEKLKSRLQEVKDTPRGSSSTDKTLIIEFSIENAVTVKRREEKLDRFRGGRAHKKDNSKSDRGEKRERSDRKPKEEYQKKGGITKKRSFDDDQGKRQSPKKRRT